MMFTLRYLSLALLAVALCSAGGCVAEDIPSVTEEVVVMTVTCEGGDKVKVKESGKDTETDCDTAAATYGSEFCNKVKEKCPKEATGGANTPATLNVTAKKEENKYVLQSAVQIAPASSKEQKNEPGPEGDKGQLPGQSPETAPGEAALSGSKPQVPGVDQSGVDLKGPKPPEGNAGGSADGAGAPNPNEKETAPSTTADKPTPPSTPTHKGTRSEPERLDASDAAAWARVTLLLLPVAVACLVAC